MDTRPQTEAIARELWGGPVPAALPGEGEHASAGDVLPETRPHGNCLCPWHRYADTLCFRHERDKLRAFG